VWIIYGIFSFLAWPIVYVAIPVYVFGLVITTGLRDFSSIFDFRGFTKSLPRKLF